MLTVVIVCGAVFSGFTASPAHATPMATAAAPQLAPGVCAGVDPGALHGVCYRTPGGGLTFLGSYRDTATGLVFICLDYGLSSAMGPHSFISPSASVPLYNQSGTRINDALTRVLGYVISRYAPSGSSGSNVTDAALALITREVMKDGYFDTAITSTSQASVMDTTYGVGANVLSRAQAIWTDARTHLGPYSAQISGIPTQVYVGQIVTVMVTVRSAAGAPMGGYPVRVIAKSSDLRIVSGSAATDSSGQASLTIQATSGTPSPATLSVEASGLPGVYPRIALPPTGSLHGSALTQRGLVATSSTSRASVSASIVPRWRPVSLQTSSSATQSATGRPVTDLVTMGGPYGWNAGPGTDTLYGPFPTPPTAGSCSSTAPQVGVATFTATTETQTTSALVPTVAGYYTWVAHVNADPASGGAAVTSACGLTTETVLVKDQPVLTTQINTQRAPTGSTLRDSVTAAHTGGATITGRWRILGPLAPMRIQHGAVTAFSCGAAGWSRAPIAASGTNTINGGHTLNGLGAYRIRAAGCYTYTEMLNGTATSWPTTWTTPGISSETALTPQTPHLATQISAQKVTARHPITDTITVTGTSGVTITGSYRIAGPVTPVNHSCLRVNWRGAAVVARGNFTVHGNGATRGIGRYTPTRPGCYTYIEKLNPTTVTNGLPWTQPGARTETALVTPAPVVDPDHDGDNDITDPNEGTYPAYPPTSSYVVVPHVTTTYRYIPHAKKIIEHKRVHSTCPGGWAGLFCTITTWIENIVKTVVTWVQEAVKTITYSHKRSAPRCYDILIHPCSRPPKPHPTPPTILGGIPLYDPPASPRRRASRPACHLVYVLRSSPVCVPNIPSTNHSYGGRPAPGTGPHHSLGHELGLAADWAWNNVAKPIGYAVRHPIRTVKAIATSTIHDFTHCNIRHLMSPNCGAAALDIATFIPIAGQLTKAIRSIRTVRDIESTARAAEAARATKAAKEAADTVVLGHYPEYVDLAEATDGRTFQIPKKIWDSMSPTEQWGANQKFLDRAIARGSNIRLATPADAAREGSYFERELQYLESHGYAVGPNGMSMTAPGGR